MIKSLNYAHSKQILHRDVKLANFVVSSDEETVKLIDFGISVMVSRKSPSISCNAPTGTFNYMSLEQTGRISKMLILEVYIAHNTKNIPEIKNVPAILNHVIQKMCAKNPSERYKSTQRVLNDLEFIQENLDSIPEDFTVGENDIQEFQIPNKLYGRDEELQLLKDDIVDFTTEDELSDVICSVVPEVELLIGKQEAPVQLQSIKETEDRLFKALNTFFKCFMSERTLILVIDDLQWADTASLQFLEKLLKANQNDIFIIGAYRDDDVDESHGLKSIIHEYDSISEIKLQPLKLKDLNEMVAHTLISTEEKTLKLSELIHKKTLGNPFFSREFINALYQEELVYFKDGVWNWDVQKVEKKNFSSNVVDFMVKN